MPASRPAVYVVGKDKVLRQRLCSTLTCLPWPVEGLASIQQLDPALAVGCIVAVDDNDLDLLPLLSKIRSQSDCVRLILVTSRADIASAVAALRQGVHDLIEMPIVERDLTRRVTRAMDGLGADHINDDMRG